MAQHTSQSPASFFVRIWRNHEEGVLYAVAALIYIPAGVFLKEIVLNWIVGITFPFVVVYLVPRIVRHMASEVRT